MKGLGRTRVLLALAGVSVLLVATACRDSMPHAFTWPVTGDQIPTHPKPPEGGYYSNWDPYAASIEVTSVPVQTVNPVRTQMFLIATVKDKDGKPLPNRRVEWIINDDGVGDIIEVDESGWRASRGYKVDNYFGVSHTNNFSHKIDMGNDDPSDDIMLEKGQTWCVIMAAMEGATYVTAYCPAIYDRSKHKAFIVRQWYDVKWTFPPPATNPIGTPHELVTTVVKNTDGTFIPNHTVTYRIVDGPAAVFEPGGAQTATVPVGNDGLAKVTLKQTTATEGVNTIAIDIDRAENAGCCEPAVKIAQGQTTKTWVGPKIAIDKNCTPSAMVGDAVNYTIVVNNPSPVDATNVVVTDTIPNGIAYGSSTPAGQASGNTVTWSLGALKGGASATINVQAKATATGKFENCAEVRADHGLQGRDCCTTVVTSPKLAIEKRCPQELSVCDTIEYIITVRNTGDGVARNVKVEDKMPDGVTTTDGRNSVSASLGDLGPGEAKEVRIQAKATKPGRYENRVTASADGGLMAETTCTTNYKQPVLAVTKTGPDKRYIGRSATYEITVTNKGDYVAKNTVVTDPIPGGTSFESASDGGQFSGGRVTWQLGDMAPGASKKVSLVLKTTTAGAAKNTATATAVCAEANASVDMMVEGVPAILLEMIDIADPIEIGGQETYEITVTNQGSAADTNIVVVCTLPPEMDYVSSTGPTQATVTGKTVKFAPYPSLPAKQRIVYKVVGKAMKEGDVRFKVVLDADILEPAVEETESTHIY